MDRKALRTLRNTQAQQFKEVYEQAMSKPESVACVSFYDLTGARVTVRGGKRIILG